MSPKASSVHGNWVRDVQMTTRFAKSIKAPTDGQAFYFDAEKKELALRVLPSGAKAWIINKTHNGKLYRRVLQPLDRCTYEQACREADKAIGQITSGAGEYALSRDQRRAQREHQERQASEAARARQDAKQHTLRRLCELYVADLERRGRSSSGDAASLFRVHVYEGAEASRPAREVTGRDIAEICRRVVDAGKGRTAAKLRSYLRAAYQRAAEAQTDATASADLIALGVESNPVAATKALSEFNKADDRAPLNEEELAVIFQRLSSDEGLPARAAWLAVLLGGQRPAQLLRAKVTHYGERFTVTNGKSRTVDLLTLFDGKGRRREPREHLVPAIGAAATLLQTLVADSKERDSEWLFSTHGRVALRTETVNDVVVAISNELAKEAKKAKRRFEPFSMKHLRAAVETQLAALGVTKEVRAQLLSHGVSGVQDKHYNKYDFLKEKTEALELWHARVAKLKRGASRPHLEVVAAP